MTTAAALTTIRNIAGTTDGVHQTMTAREMALAPHTLGRTGDKVTTADGRVWYWSRLAGVWVR